MPTTEETLKAARRLRIQIDATVDQVTSALVESWARAWAELLTEWEATTLELVSAAVDGKWPNRRTVLRNDKVVRALDTTRKALEDLAATSGVTITGALPDLAALAQSGHETLVGSQLPRGAGLYDPVEARTLEAIVRRTAGQVTALHYPLAADAERAMKSTLIRGVVLGTNPRDAASVMVRRVEGNFNGGLNRALVIARTEMLDVHRAVTMAADQANASILDGWQWLAALDRRTCPSCWAMHGRRFKITEPGPEDHQQGRCARVPVTLSWRELGFDVPEPAPVWTDGRKAFDALPVKDQTAIMGARRLELLKSGAVGWDDLPVKRSTVGWRDSWAPAPVSQLAGQ